MDPFIIVQSGGVMLMHENGQTRRKSPAQKRKIIEEFALSRGNVLSAARVRHYVYSGTIELMGDG
jgi:hypothetical protein